MVITGVGASTALGNTRAQSLAGLRACTSRTGEVELDYGLRIRFGACADTVPPYKRTQDYTSQFTREATDEALVESGLLDDVDPQRIATVMGCSKGRLHRLVSSHPQLDIQEFPGNTLGVELAARHGFEGPVLNYPAACATGLACIIAGANLLRDGAVDAVIAGSAEASAYALTMASFINMGALSLDIMRPFDRARDGFNPGEGAAAFVLEREADARARGAKIIARLAGFDLRCDAFHITSADASGETIALSIRRALKHAGWQPSDVQYISAHGTGTRQNDAIEARAIHAVFGKSCPPVSSLKPYIGHLLGGSASAELALAMMALRDGFLPPTPGLNKPDPDLAAIQFVPGGGIAARLSRFLKLSLGFGGHIGCVAIELCEA